MPFWGGGWANPYVEPKRPYRFIVPFPVVVPDGSSTETSISDIFPNSRFEGNKYGSGPEQQYFDFPCIRCKKPGYQTEAYKASHVVRGYQPILPDAPASFQFTPVELELIDTYDFDLESTLTAYLYGGGQLPSGENGDPSNGTPRSIKITNIDFESRDFQIIELLDMMALSGPTLYPTSNTTRFLGAAGDSSTSTRMTALDAIDIAGYQEIDPSTMMFKARKFILRNSYISGVTFGEHSQDTNSLSKVTVQIVYDRFDYEWILYRPSEELAERLWSETYRGSLLKHNPNRLTKEQLERMAEIMEEVDVSEGLRTEEQAQAAKMQDLQDAVDADQGGLAALEAAGAEAMADGDDADVAGPIDTGDDFDVDEEAGSIAREEDAFAAEVEGNEAAADAARDEAELDALADEELALNRDDDEARALLPDEFEPLDLGDSADVDAAAEGLEGPDTAAEVEEHMEGLAPRGTGETTGGEPILGGDGPENTYAGPDTNPALPPETERNILRDAAGRATDLPAPDADDWGDPTEGLYDDDALPAPDAPDPSAPSPAWLDQADDDATSADDVADLTEGHDPDPPDSYGDGHEYPPVGVGDQPALTDEERAQNLQDLLFEYGDDPDADV